MSGPKTARERADDKSAERARKALASRLSAVEATVAAMRAVCNVDKDVSDVGAITIMRSLVSMEADLRSTLKSDRLEWRRQLDQIADRLGGRPMPASDCFAVSMEILNVASKLKDEVRQLRTDLERERKIVDALTRGRS